MRGLIAWWAKNNVAANLLMVLILVVGTMSFLRIDREVFPNQSIPVVSVSIAWPGSDPQQVEEQLVLRIEERMSDLEGIDSIQSTAREGGATVQLTVDGDYKVENILNEIKNRVDGISTFPDDAFPPIVQIVDINPRSHLIAISGDLDALELNRLARSLRDEVAQLPGGSPLVSLLGVRQEEVSIEISQAALRSYGLTFSEVAQAIRGSSVNISGGSVRTQNANIPIATRSLADSQEEFENIIIRQLPGGGVVRVRDVATVIDGFQDVNFKVELDGSSAIIIQVNSPANSNIVELSKAINEWVETRDKQLAPQARVAIINDTSVIYFGRMKLVSSNAILGLFLVLVTLMLFLRPAVAFWVSVGIAISIIGAFIFLPAVGVSLNILSLFAFLLVIGVIVDDAIIVGESIHNQVENGNSGLSAAVMGTQFVIKPVFFAVLTTIIAFAPWLFISGGAAELTKNISWTITFALAFSLLESFFILPAHLAHMKKQDEDHLYYRLQSVFANGLVNFATSIYRPILQIAVQARYVTITFFFMAFFMSIALLNQGWIKTTFFPEVEIPIVQLNVTMAEGTAFSRTLQVYDGIQQSANELKGELGQRGGVDVVEKIFLSAGEANINAFMTVSTSDKRGDLTVEAISEMWRNKIGDIPDAEDISVDFAINNGGTDITFGVEGDNIETIRLAMVDIQNYLRAQPGVYDVQNDLQSSTDELLITLKPGAERFGLTLAQVSGQVRQAFFGEEVQRLPRGGEDVRVIVRLPKSERSDINTIQRTFIRTPDGREVPLSAIVDVEFAPAYKRIQRRDRKRAASVSAQVSEGVEVREIMQNFRRSFQPGWESRYPDVSLRRRGAAEAQSDFMSELGALYLVALFAIYMLLSIAFGSYFQPILIMSAIPFAYMGALYGHALIGIKIGLFSYFGIGAAAGVVINDNLVLIDYVNRLRAQGAGAVEALVQAGTGRFRPIVLTSITTFVGLLPVMFETSIDAQFLKGTIVAMAFGIFFAAFVTLLFVPAMYVVGVDISRFYRWAWTGQKQPALGKGASSENSASQSLLQKS